MTKSAFPQTNVFSGLKNDSQTFWTFSNIKINQKSNFPSFIQHKQWQSPIFRIYSNHKILQRLFSKLFRHPKWQVQLSASFSAIKNDKVQLSELFLPIKIIKSNFPHFSRHKKLQSSNFRTFSDIKNDKVQISASFSAIQND